MLLTVASSSAIMWLLLGLRQSFNLRLHLGVFQHEPTSRASASAREAVQVTWRASVSHVEFRSSALVSCFLKPMQLPRGTTRSPGDENLVGLPRSTSQHKKH
jgi:hypothetical protein